MAWIAAHVSALSLDATPLYPVPISVGCAYIVDSLRANVTLLSLDLSSCACACTCPRMLSPVPCLLHPFPMPRCL